MAKTMKVDGAPLEIQILISFALIFTPNLPLTAPNLLCSALVVPYGTFSAWAMWRFLIAITNIVNINALRVSTFCWLWEKHHRSHQSLPLCLFKLLRYRRLFAWERRKFPCRSIIHLTVTENVESIIQKWIFNASVKREVNEQQKSRLRERLSQFPCKASTMRNEYLE